MSIGEVLQFGSLIAVVMIIAYFARRSQSVGLPPGATKTGDQNGHAVEPRQDGAGDSRRREADGRGQPKPPQP